MLNTKLKSVLNSDDALQRYQGSKSDFSGNFDSAFFGSENSLKLNVKITRSKRIRKLPAGHKTEI